MLHHKVRFYTLWFSATLLLSTNLCSAANPLNLGSNIRTADPSAHVWQDGRLYLYSSHDEECQHDFFMKDWRVFSSGDLQQWTDHGTVLKLSDISWADNYAWAPDAAYKNGNYYLVFPAGTGVKNRQQPQLSNKWMGIGVAVSKSATGPFKDAIGAPLWRSPYANDPSLFIDDNGKAYLYFHGRDFDYYVVEMADDLLSIKGDFIKMDMGGYEPKMEGPWVFKRHQLYYFTMPENNRTLTYYTSLSPTGPWQYRGIIMAAEGEQNNHHSIVQYQGNWLLFYHRWSIDPNSQCQKPQRQIAAEYLYFNKDGTIQQVERTQQGLQQPGRTLPGKTVQ
jgi:beta-xylosidase